MKSYMVNEIFYSVQGEGMRSGTPNVFVRFSGCNMDCHRGHEEPNAAFDCDTEFVSGMKMSADEIVERANITISKRGAKQIPGVIFTGGEPTLQLDKDLVDAFKSVGAHTAIETNGTNSVSGLGLDWVTVSPKVAEHALRVDSRVNELKYVRHTGQGIPKPRIDSDWKLISPAFDGYTLNRECVDWCQTLVLANPKWRLSLQTHKWIGVR